MATILITDDHAVNREFLVTLLGYGGHRLLEAADGAQALTLARETVPDLIISDILMPNMNGYELVKQLRNEPALAAIPVIFYTATYREHAARSLADSCGVSVVLPKPSLPGVILDAVQSILGASRAASGAGPQTPLPATSLKKITGHLVGYLNHAEASSQILASVAERDTLLASERKGLQEASDKLSVTIEQLQAVSLKLATIVELGMDLTSQRDPQSLVDLACRMAQNLCAGRYAAVGMFAADGKTLRHFATRGYDPDTQGRLDSLFHDVGALRYLLAERRPRRLHSLRERPQNTGLPGIHPAIESFLGVPIASPSGILGWLYLADKTGAPEFSGIDEDMAATIGGQVAVTYENLQRYDELQRRGAELELEVSQRKGAEAKVRELNATLEAKVAARTAQLQALNQDLESFDYSVSHDLHAPLRAIGGYSAALRDKYADRLDDTGRDYIGRVCRAAARMTQLIDDVLRLSGVARAEIKRSQVELSALARELLRDLSERDPARRVDVVIADGITAHADEPLLRMALENLLGNAWKFTSKHERARIEFGALPPAAGSTVAYFVRDDGAGFDMQYAANLFGTFRRLHRTDEFPGSGVGLSTVRRIVQRHGGRIWAESARELGTTVFFTLAADQSKG